MGATESDTPWEVGLTLILGGIKKVPKSHNIALGPGIFMIAFEIILTNCPNVTH